MAETDVLGAPYTVETLLLRPDDQGEVVATLVHRRAESSTRKAVLHVHGFCDYFFQTVAADFWVRNGYDFYALDLRKYGRSLRPHQTPNYVDDLRAYYEELDLAYHRITQEHDHVVFSAHSTGGLTVPLWLHDRGHRAAGVFLNSPWIDMHGDTFTRLLAMPVIHRLGLIQPMRLVPREVTGVYSRCLHRDFVGEWDFDLAWKPIESWPAYAGWLAAIRRGHATLHHGLDLTFPALVLSSTRSTTPTELGEDVHSTDIVLDVEQIRRWSSSLGRHVTYVGIEGARHDVFLSREQPRAVAFTELGRWLTAYVDG